MPFANQSAPEFLFLLVFLCFRFCSCIGLQFVIFLIGELPAEIRAKLQFVVSSRGLLAHEPLGMQCHSQLSGYLFR